MKQTIKPMSRSVKYVGTWLAMYFTQVFILGFETQLCITRVNYVDEIPNEVTIQFLNPGHIPGSVTIKVLNPGNSPRLCIPGLQNPAWISKPRRKPQVQNKGIPNPDIYSRYFTQVLHIWVSKTR